MSAIASAPLAGSNATIRGLHASTAEELPFARGTVIRAFLLERQAGNVLIYANGVLGADLDAWRDLGAIERQYLGHWHEAMFGEKELARRIDAPLFVHADDAAEVRARRPVRAAFSRPHGLDGDLEVIPIPGHTPGSTAYLWRSGGRRLLFTADSLYLDGDEWVAAVLGSSDRGAYLESLERLRETEFDVLVPWAASADGPMLAEVAPDERRERLDAVIDRVRRGENR
jgi:glyoxylase-like metal-dependent hydrolase (beta-lactamase superfamily II)